MLKPPIVLAAVIALAPLAPAYSPPVDTAGPLTVRIQQPALGAYGAGGNLELSSPDLAIPIVISLTNSAGVPIRGTLRVTVIDGWSVKPANAVPFEVPARGEKPVEFTATAGRRTYNAHYPVHAFAEFEHEGKPLIAHPVLVLETRYPNPPRADSRIEWKPVAVPASGGIALWRVPVHRESLRVQSGPGLSSKGETFEAAAPVEFTTLPRGGFVMRLGPRAPSMREVVEAASVEFPLRLPAAPAARLTFATAATSRTGLRVRVRPFEAQPAKEPRTLFDQQRSGDLLEHQVDLSEFAGQAITLRFEAQAASAAEVRWIDPVVHAGAAKAAAPFPPDALAESRVLGKAGGYDVTLWPGRRGILDSAIGFVNGKRRLLFQGFRVRVLGDSLEDAHSVSTLLGVSDESSNGRYRLRHRFESWAGPFELMSETWVEGPALRARLWLEHTPAPVPWRAMYLEEVKAGQWTETPERVYGGPGNVIEKPRAFQLSYDGHSLATAFAGFDFENGVSMVEALDVPPDRLEVDPERKVAALATPHAQTITFIPVSNVWEGVKAWRDMNGLRAAAGVPQLASRFVFDYWGGANYADGEAQLRRAFRYGLTDAAVVWHNWQRWGYDYRLPDVYPPDPARGTVEDFASMVRACREQGVLFAPHDNYIDFYPDFDGFSYRDIVFDADGSPERAWFHFERQAQSYRARPDRLRPFIERNLKLIKSGFAPNAYFIDVWSSMAPYDYWTGDGSFVDRLATREAWGGTFAWIRDFLGGNAPQISEAGHDQLIGWLDGAQANHLRVDPKGPSFTWRITAADSERIPWFDAAHHDKFVLHGAGYPDRYAAGLDLETHGIYSDDYIAMEVLTGRPAMVSDLFGRDVVRKYWLLHDLAQALALRKIDGVEFAGGNLHRQQVRWDNGADIRVNRGEQDWSAAEHALPQYGYYARVPVEGGAVESAVERRGGRTFEWSRSPSSIYVNGRGNLVSVAGVTTAGAARITRDADAIVVTPLPSSGRISVALAFAALPWKTPAPRRIETIDEQGKIVRVRSVADSGAGITLDCEPGVFAYRLR